MLSEEGQRQKTTYWICNEMPGISKCIETEGTLLVGWAGWGEDGKYLWMDMGFLQGDDGNFLEVDEMVTRICECAKKHWLVHHESVNFVLCRLYLNNKCTRKKYICCIQAVGPWGRCFPSPNLCFVRQQRLSLMLKLSSGIKSKIILKSNSSDR